jgi:PucR family transcriptional regulator, purine catabolism regulatory protein
MDALERQAHDHRGRIFFTARDDRIVVLAETPAPQSIVSLLAQHSIPVGTSSAVSFDALPRGVAEAERALRHAVETDQPIVGFQAFLDRGVLGALRREQVGTVARGMLRVLQTHDAARGADLLTTVRVWVQNECAWDTTARELGIHRHTLRNRVQLAGRLLGLDLNLLRDRLELWAAVQLMAED